MTDVNDRTPDHPVTADAAERIASRLVPGRECGTCMLCCKVMAIDALGKPPGVWCRHIKRGVGCDIYEQRPSECRTFYCHRASGPRVARRELADLTRRLEALSQDPEAKGRSLTSWIQQARRRR